MFKIFWLWIFLVFQTFSTKIILEQAIYDYDTNFENLQSFEHLQNSDRLQNFEDGPQLNSRILDSKISESVLSHLNKNDIIDVLSECDRTSMKSYISGNGMSCEMRDLYGKYLKEVDTKDLINDIYGLNEKFSANVNPLTFLSSCKNIFYNILTKAYYRAGEK